MNIKLMLSHNPTHTRTHAYAYVAAYMHHSHHYPAQSVVGDQPVRRIHGEIRGPRVLLLRTDGPLWHFERALLGAVFRLD